MVVTPTFGIANVVTLAPADKMYVAQDNVCSWVLTLPYNAYINDTLTMRVNLLDNSGITYMIANSFSDSGSNYSIGTASKGSRIQIYYP